MRIQTILRLIQITLSIALLAIASYTDIKTRKIPNTVSMSALAISMIIFVIDICVNFQTIFAIPQGIDILFRVVLFFAIFAFGATGMIGIGDIKIMMTLSLLNSVSQVLVSVVIACIAVLIVDICTNKKAIQKYRYIFSQLYLFRKFDFSMSEKRKIPFAPYLCFGYIVALVGMTILG